MIRHLVSEHLGILIAILDYHIMALEVPLCNIHQSLLFRHLCWPYLLLASLLIEHLALQKTTHHAPMMLHDGQLKVLTGHCSHRSDFTRCAKASRRGVWQSVRPGRLCASPTFSATLNFRKAEQSDVPVIRRMIFQERCSCELLRVSPSMCTPNDGLKYSSCGFIPLQNAWNCCAAFDARYIL